MYQYPRLAPNCRIISSDERNTIVRLGRQHHRLAGALFHWIDNNADWQIQCWRYNSQAVLQMGSQGCAGEYLSLTHAPRSTWAQWFRSPWKNCERASAIAWKTHRQRQYDTLDQFQRRVRRWLDFKPEASQCAHWRRSINLNGCVGQRLSWR